MIDVVALSVVAGAGLFLLGLGAAALAAPASASRFLSGFAGSRALHVTELALRLLIGAAFVWAAPLLPSAAVFSVFGWVLLGSTTVMLLLPWRWHQRFARFTVPRALHFLPLIGAASAAVGLLTLGAVWRSGA